MALSVPQHGEPLIDRDGVTSRQFSDFLEEVADLYGLDSLPDEDERVFIDGKASLQLATFLQNAAESAGLVNQPDEGEIILLENGAATFPFQDFIDDLAG